MFGLAGRLEQPSTYPRIPPRTLNFFLERYTESYRREMCAFVEAVVNQTPVPVSAEDGLKAAAIAMAAGTSARENRPVKLAEIYEGIAPVCQVS